MAVPVCAATVTPTLWPAEMPGALEPHWTFVAVVQDVVVHAEVPMASDPTVPVAVKSKLPKFRPVTVTVPPKEVGAFGAA